MKSSVGIIMKTALKERMRRKELYIIVILAILLLLLCSSDVTSITMNGEAVTGFSNMFLLMHTLVHFVGCVLAVVLSLGTIPKEYERKNSHLVWVRNISQEAYHGRLTLANVCASLSAAAILYLALGVYAVTKGHGEVLLRMIPAFLILSLSISFVSLFVSVMSIKLPVMAVGILGVIVMVFGVFHGMIGLFKNMLGGLGGKCMSFFLFLVPDLSGIQNAACHFATGEKMEAHLIFVLLFSLWVVSLGLFIFRKKEA